MEHSADCVSGQGARVENGKRDNRRTITHRGVKPPDIGSTQDGFINTVNNQKDDYGEAY
jgi:hypothetical protein